MSNTKLNSPSPTTLIKRFVSALSPNTLFSTRDCLLFGKRAAVDKALLRLVNNTHIVRVARGMFVKTSPGVKLKLPTIYEIAKKKAVDFGREIFTHNIDAAKQLKLISQESNNPNEAIFASTGKTSSFRYGNIKIIMRRIASKYLKLGDSVPGLVIRALLHLGKGVADYKAEFERSPYFLNMEERQTLRLSAQYMPWWISDQIVTTQPWGWYMDPSKIAQALAR